MHPRTVVARENKLVTYKVRARVIAKVTKKVMVKLQERLRGMLWLCVLLLGMVWLCVRTLGSKHGGRRADAAVGKLLLALHHLSSIYASMAP